MRVLLELGADPQLTTDNGTTALMAAAGVGIWAPGENPGTHEEALAAVKLAFEAGGGDVNDVDKNGETALHGAVYRGGAVAVIQFLVDKGAQARRREREGLDAADRRRRRGVHARRAEALSRGRGVASQAAARARAAGAAVDAAWPRRDDGRRCQRRALAADTRARFLFAPIAGKPQRIGRTLGRA